MGLELVPLAPIAIDLTDPIILPNTPAGTRVIVEVRDARVEGERLRAKSKGATGADWLTIGPDATGTVDGTTLTYEVYELR
jgi:hypothetical protein